MREGLNKAYDNEGRVDDPGLAHEMADIEAEGHKKTLGVIPPPKEKIHNAERAAEEHAVENGKIISEAELPSAVSSYLQEKQPKSLGAFKIEECRQIDPPITKIFPVKEQMYTRYIVLGRFDKHDQGYQGSYSDDFEFWVTDGKIVNVEERHDARFNRPIEKGPYTWLDRPKNES